MASLQRDINVDTVSAGKALVIPHKSLSSSVSTPGTLAYDPTGKAVIYCDGTAWFLIGGTSVPIVTTDNAISRFNGTAGTVQNSLASISDAGELTTPSLKTDTITESTAANGVRFAVGSHVVINDTTASTTSATGSLIVAGGAGIAGDLHVAGTATAATPTLSTHLTTKAYVDGLGAVIGPASSTDNAIARFDLATGKLLQNSSATLSDGGELSTLSIKTDTIAESTAANGVRFAAGSHVVIQDTTASVSTGSGSITTLGGAGIAGDLWVGGSVNAGSIAGSSSVYTVGTITTIDNLAGTGAVANANYTSIGNMVFFNFTITGLTEQVDNTETTLSFQNIPTGAPITTDYQFGSACIIGNKNATGSVIAAAGPSYRITWISTGAVAVTILVSGSYQKA